MAILDHIGTHARINFKRHLRNPALWWLAIVTPIAARFMVPTQDANYAVLSVNNAYPALSSSVIGLKLGVITASLLSPLAYIFLRAGPTRQTPWQVEDVTPARRSAQFLGGWIADTLILWCILAVLAVAGIILSGFRIPLSDIRPFETVFTFSIIAAPSMAIIAAIRTCLNARPLWRGALGDVLFFFFWITALGTATAASMDGGGTGSSGVTDIFGFITPIAQSVDVPIETMSIGAGPSATSASGTIEINAMRGVTQSPFILSRLTLIGLALGLVLLCSLIFKPRRHSHKLKRSKFKSVTVLSKTLGNAFGKLAPQNGVTSHRLWTHLFQILTPKLYILVLLAIAIAGFYLPFRRIIGPAIWLVMLFPLTTHSARWTSRNLDQFSETLPMSKPVQIIWPILASSLLLAATCLPALVKILLSDSKAYLMDWMFIVGILPVLIFGIGYMTKSSFTARLILLIVWYLYLNLA